MNKNTFLVTVLLYAVAVFYLAITTPIGPNEAYALYSTNDFVSFLMKSGRSISDTFFGLRLFFVLGGFFTVFLFYLLSKRHFIKIEDAYLSTFIFMFLPGFLTGTVLVNVSIVVLPIILLFVLFYQRGYFWVLIVLMFALFFLHEASMIFFMALLLYALLYRDKKLAIASLAFLSAFVFLPKGVIVDGRPSGHFLEIFGLYATLFSPFLFIYFFYAMYRMFLRGKKDLVWYIAFSALVFSLLLSIRQKVYITDFAPYMMIAIPLMLDVYYQSVRVRLPQFQKIYTMGFYFVLSTLLLSALMIVFHQFTYCTGGKHPKHFASRIYVPYDLAQDMKRKGIVCHESKNRREALQLLYYGIPSCRQD